jgi:hypothetical protein
VKFGTVAASTFTVNSATSITVTAPAGSGTVDVTVTTPVATSATSGSDQFTYATSTTITAVGGFVSTAASGLTTLAVNPQTAGDVLVVLAHSPVTTLSVTSVSGGGVTTWTKGVAFVGSIGAEEEIWFGKVTATGASTVTFTWSASTAGHTMEYGAQEFSAGLGAGTTWALDKSGTLNGASSTSVPFPTLTASRAGELYFGYSTIANNAVATSSGGFTYVPTNEANLAAYDPNVSGAVSPAGTQSPAGTSSAVAGLLVAAP